MRIPDRQTYWTPLVEATKPWARDDKAKLRKIEFAQVQTISYRHVGPSVQIEVKINQKRQIKTRESRAWVTWTK